MSTLIHLADRCRDAGFSDEWCTKHPWDDPTPVPSYDAPSGGGGGEAWSFLGMGANAWFFIILGLIVWGLVARSRARRRAEAERHEALRTRYQAQAAPESNLGGGGGGDEWADYDQDHFGGPLGPPRSMYGDQPPQQQRRDDWEEL